ncbi:uncharacterized protein [Parasteatoda tepidariorum]|uniref:uncharacterized protein n=1 Tax=Parasteatoda tepidariorum TaxID=114398 RepID=UPI00077FD6FD|nr:uncharacterized protein LOC107444235 [Parasteatoda tepidariorum]
MFFNTIVLRRTLLSVQIIPTAFMAKQSKKDFEAIETYNKLRKKPLAETSYSDSELRSAQKFFDQVKKYRQLSEEGFEPSKLFMVWRVAPLIHRPIWEKEIILKLGLHKDKAKYATVKNTASNNKMLWKVKHLIRLKPITFPDGLPTNDDLYGTFLKQSGELVIAERLKVKPEDLERDPEFERVKLDQRTIKENLRIKWNAGYPKMY